MPRPVIRATSRTATRFFVALTVLSLLTTPVAASPGAAPSPASDGGGDAAPIQQGLLNDLRSGELDRFVVEFTAQANLAGAGLMAASGPARREATPAEVNMMRELYRLPHGARVQSDGTWQVVK